METWGAKIDERRYMKSTAEEILTNKWDLD